MYNNKKIVNALYLVATPIGNLNDISKRAIIVLNNVNLILTENIKYSRILFKKISINKKTLSFNKNNEKLRESIVIKKLKNGENIALISNSGTPIINDPGYGLVKKCLYYNIKVIPIPGPCSIILALISSSLPSNKFCYEGFLPKKKNKILLLLKKIKYEERTLIINESPKRLEKSLFYISLILGKKRIITLAKELTKINEFIISISIYKLINLIKNKKIIIKGEIILIIEGFKKKNKICKNIINTYKILIKKNLSNKDCIIITSKIHKIKKNSLYKYINKNKNLII